MKQNKVIVYLVICLTASFLISCSNLHEFSPNQMIENVLATEDEVTYYGELKMDVKGLDDLDAATIKEWRGKNNVRVELTMGEEFVISVLNGDTLKVYSALENMAFIMEDDQMEGILYHPKEQVEVFLEMIRDTHEIETIGEETFLGRPTFHLIAKKRKDAKSLYGDQELWIDKEHWMVLKMKSISGEIQVDTEYTKIDYNPKIDASTFELKLPDGVEFEKLTDDDFESKEIVLEEIPEKIGKSALHLPSEQKHMIDTITYVDIDGEFSYKSIDIDYKNNGLPFITLSIMSSDKELEDDEGREMLNEIAEQVTVRSNSGHFFEIPNMRYLDWEEGGINYTIELIDPNLTLKDALRLADKMIEINKKGD